MGESKCGWGQFVSHSDRGVTTVVGFVLMFALLVSTFAMYQSDVVPHQNAEIEHAYSESLDGEMADLQSAARRVSSKGSPASSTVQGGPEYPARALGVNGPAPAARLATTDRYTVTLEGLETADGRYWNGSERSFQTRLLAFEPRYNFADREEAYYLENGVGVRLTDGGEYTSAVGGEVLEGNRLELVLLEGSVDEQKRVHDVTFRPVSTSTDYHEVNTTTSPDGDPPAVRVPTVRSADSWDDLADDSSRIADVSLYCAGTDQPKSNCPDERVGHAEIVFETGENVTMRITKLSLDAAESTDPEYVTTEAATQKGLTTHRTHEITVTVRDRYGNPTSGEVELHGGGSGTLRPGTTVYADGGTARFVYEPKVGAVANVKARIDPNEEPYQRLDFRFDDGSSAGAKRFDVHDDGQLFRNIGDPDSINVSDVYAESVDDPPCLLGDVDSGLLGLLTTITCIDNPSKVTSTKLQLKGVNSTVTYDLYFELVDVDEDDYLYDGSTYEGDEYVSVRIDSAAKSQVGDDVVFVGTLEPAAMNHIYHTKSGRIDILDESSYTEVQWERECEDTDIWGNCESYLYGVDNFETLFDEPIESMYVEKNLGRTTFEVE